MYEVFSFPCVIKSNKESKNIYFVQNDVRVLPSPLSSEDFAPFRVFLPLPCPTYLNLSLIAAPCIVCFSLVLSPDGDVYGFVVSLYFVFYFL